MSVAERISDVSYRIFDGWRHRASSQLAEGTAGATAFDHLAGHNYALLITYRRNGEGVPTPVWFGLRDGKVYVHTERRTAKVKRIRANPRVRVAPCTLRGKPRGPAAEGTARIVEPDAEAAAEEAIQATYGLGRRIYERPLERSGLDFVFLEITPAATERDAA